MIPNIIHQTWKTNNIPKKWKYFVKKVKELNPEWEYRLWTDEDNDKFVQQKFPDFYDIYKGFSKNIMRADVIRYIIMYKIGGVYLDLDYEVLKPFDFQDKKVVLPYNRSKQYGDKIDNLGNCFFASIPGHPFWLDVINDLQDNPPVVTDYHQVGHVTGPRLLTRIYFKNNYPDIHTPGRLLYHPPNNRKHLKKVRNNGVSLGIHHPWGSWKERWTLSHIKDKFKGFWL